MSSSDWMTKDFYKTLGVSKDASQEEIKKSYRKLARDLHPDKHRGDASAEERFKAVSEAYAVLGHADKRKEYDEQRALFANGGGFRFPSGGTTGAEAGFDLSDLFGTFFGGGGRPRSTAQPRRGADVESEVTISFQQAVEGVTVPLRMTSDEACRACHGTGARAGTVPRVCPGCEGTGMQTSASGGLFAMTEPCRVCRGRGLVVDDPCPTCHGSGRGQAARTMQVRVPAGVKDAQRIRLKGKGAPGERGGPNGDLYLTVNVTPHQTFGRSGDNLTITVPIAFDEAALGAKIKVPTLDGATVTVKVPPGTPNGRTFRVRGRGAPRSDGTRADLLVTVEVAVPGRLSDDERAAVEAYRSARGGAADRQTTVGG